MIRVPGQREGSWRYKYGEYIYHEDARYKRRRYICAATSSKYLCPVTILVLENGEPLINGIHNHPRPTIELREPVIRELKRRSLSHEVMASEIVDTVFTEHPEIIGIMTRKTAQQIVNNERLNGRPPVPQTFRDLGTMLENWPIAASIYKGQFTADDGSIGIVFYEEIMFHRLSTTPEFHVDGTFKCVPRSPKASQLLIIHMRRADVGIPVVFVLCERRTAAFYRALWNFLILQSPNLVNHLNVLNCDYERALISATRSVFGDQVRIRGCWFHFIRAVSRKWQQLRLPRNEHGNSVLHKVWAVALLPAGNFAEAIQLIADCARNLPLDQAKMTNFISYLNGFWLRYADVVSVFGSSVRTNNISEACHRHLPRRLAGVHPSMSIFIVRLVRYLKATLVTWQEMDQGLLNHRQRQTIQRPRDRHIRHVQDLLQSNRIGILDFLIMSVPRADQEEIRVDLELREGDENASGPEEAEDEVEANIGPADPIDVDREPNVVIRPHRVPRLRAVRRRREANVVVLGAPRRRRGTPRREAPNPPVPNPAQQIERHVVEPEQPHEQAEHVREDANQQQQHQADDLPERLVDQVVEARAGDNGEVERDVPPNIDPNVCRICLLEPARIVFLPCAHLCACSVCFQTLQRNYENELLDNIDGRVQNLRCPICRGDVENTLHVFV